MPEAPDVLAEAPAALQLLCRPPTLRLGRSTGTTFATSSQLEYADTRNERTQRIPPPSTEDVLQEVAQFTKADWLTLHQGDVVAKNLETDSRQIAVAGCSPRSRST